MSYRSLFNKIINLFFLSFTFSFYLRVKRRAYNSIHCVFLLHFYGNHDFLSYKLWFKKVETINLDNPHLDFLLHFLRMTFFHCMPKERLFSSLEGWLKHKHTDTQIYDIHISKRYSFHVLSFPFLYCDISLSFFFIPFLYKSTKLCCVLK